MQWKFNDSKKMLFLLNVLEELLRNQRAKVVARMQRSRTLV